MVKTPLRTPASHIAVAGLGSRLCSLCLLPAKANLGKAEDDGSHPEGIPTLNSWSLASA